jgi:hypothetical protein
MLLGGRIKWSSVAGAGVAPEGVDAAALGGFGAGGARGGTGGVWPAAEAAAGAEVVGLLLAAAGVAVLVAGVDDIALRALVAEEWGSAAVAARDALLPVRKREDELPGLAAMVLASLLVEEAVVAALRALRTLRWLVLLTVDPSSSLPSPLEALLALAGRLDARSPLVFAALPTLDALPVVDLMPLPGPLIADCGAETGGAAADGSGVALRVNAGELSELATAAGDTARFCIGGSGENTGAKRSELFLGESRLYTGDEELTAPGVSIVGEAAGLRGEPFWELPFVGELLEPAGDRGDPIVGDRPGDFLAGATTDFRSF